MTSALDANRVSTTVDAVRYSVSGRTRLGVASTWFADRVKPGDRLKVYPVKGRGWAARDLTAVVTGRWTGGMRPRERRMWG